jgi:hypothetical protein
MHAEVVWNGSIDAAVDIQLAGDDDTDDGDDDGGNGGVVVTTDRHDTACINVWNVRDAVEVLDGRCTHGAGREPLQRLVASAPVRQVLLSHDDKHLAAVLDNRVEIYGFEQLVLQGQRADLAPAARVPYRPGAANFACAWSANTLAAADAAAAAADAAAGAARGVSGDDEDARELLTVLFGDDVLVVDPTHGVVSSATVPGCRAVAWMPRCHAPAGARGGPRRDSMKTGPRSASSVGGSRGGGGGAGLLLAVAVRWCGHGSR